MNQSAKHPHIKQNLKGRSVTVEDIQKWSETQETLLRSLENVFLERQSELLDPLHDTRRLAKQVENIADKIDDSADPNVVSLKKAAGMMSESFDLIEIFFNPDAAKLTNKRRISLHGVLRKLVSILEPADRHQADGVRVHLNGSTYRNICVYESFKLLPFALINNARKYCVEGAVKVDIAELGRTIRVSVKSIGPLIEPDEKKLIFLKRKRGKWASQCTDDGSGIGLYLANIVADAHDIKIGVSSTSLERTSAKGIPLAENSFFFEVPLGT